MEIAEFYFGFTNTIYGSGSQPFLVGGTLGIKK